MNATARDLELERSSYDLGRVLVVDDRGEGREFVTGCLRAEGFDTAACRSVADLAVLFATVEPDLVVIAAELDEVPAGQPCMWIRARSGVPIVVLAGARNYDAVDVLDLGAGRVTSRKILEGVLGVSGPELDTCVRRLRTRIEAIEGWRRRRTRRTSSRRRGGRRPSSGPRS